MVVVVVVVGGGGVAGNHRRNQGYPGVFSPGTFSKKNPRKCDFQRFDVHLRQIL